MVLLAGVITTAVIAAFIYLAENAYNGVPFLSYRTVYVSLPNIGHLQQHDPVDIAGVRVGQVLQTSTMNNRALVELQLQGVGPLPVNSSVVVRAEGLLGERYVQLTPGTSHRTLPDGATITETNPIKTFTWGLPEALNLLNPKTRTALGQMINGFGQGLDGRGSQLNEAIHVGPTSGADFDTAAYAILGRPGAAQNFLPYTDAGMTALNTARTALVNMLAPTSQALGNFVTQRAATQRDLFAVNGLELHLDYGFAPTHTTAIGNRLVTLGQTLDPVLGEVPGDLRSTEALLRDAQAPLRNARAVVDLVPRAVPSALSILSSVKPDLTPLHGLFTNLDAPVSQLAIHGCDIQAFATATRSMTSWGTEPGSPWGPNSGFPFGPILGPGDGANIANTGFKLPRTNIYQPPCAFNPGATISNASLLGTLEGLLK
jgi:virulence factor Mce-like protein